MKYLFFIAALTVFLFSCKAGEKERAEVPETGVSGSQVILRTGAERLEILIPLLQNKKVGLVVNQTSVVGNDGILLLDTLWSLKTDIKKIFALEHGFRGEADAGETINNSKDSKTGLPVVSLYGKNKKPQSSQLEDLDVIVFDIQDVGARFYTYISSLHYILEACAENNKELIVCDRPNPNDYVDGPVLKTAYSSFVGMHTVPVLHGMTIGEYAMMINGEGWTKKRMDKDKITVIPVEGWQHRQKYVLPVKPSPNLPNWQSVQLYASLCFFEATDISVGRGTTYPFQVLGAPDKKYGDFSFTPESLPGWDKNPLHKGKECYGIDLRNNAPPAGLSLEYFLTFYTLSGEGKKFFTRPDWFNLLAGNNELQGQILSGMSEEEIRESWQTGLDNYKKIREKYLLYPE